MFGKYNNFESLIWMYGFYKFSDHVVLGWHTGCLCSINSVIELMIKKYSDSRETSPCFNEIQLDTFTLQHCYRYNQTLTKSESNTLFCSHYGQCPLFRTNTVVPSTKGDFIQFHFPLTSKVFYCINSFFSAEVAFSWIKGRQPFISYGGSPIVDPLKSYQVRCQQQYHRPYISVTEYAVMVYSSK